MGCRLIDQLERATTLPQCEAIAKRVMTMENAREIKLLLREERQKIAPELELR